MKIKALIDYKDKQLNKDIKKRRYLRSFRKARQRNH